MAYSMDLKAIGWNPWSISEDGLMCIEKLLEDIPFWGDYNIVEFGSGASTMFIDRFINQLGLTRVSLLSFDNSSKYAAKSDKVVLRPLVHCSDESFDGIFKNREYDPSLFKRKLSRPTSKQKNCFYKISPHHLPATIDLLIVDGPNGNGRSLAYLHTKDRLHPGSIVFIDDYDHYDFVEKFSLFHDHETVYSKHTEKDRFIILKVI
jgi:hypothetical protein